MRGVEKGLGSCEVCHQIISFPEGGAKDRTALCPRCGCIAHQRTPNSIQESWALVIASIIFYIPANSLPMMRVDSLDGVHSDTILSGVIYFFNSGSYFIALVIFIASIIVPITKMIILIYLLISIELKSTIRKNERRRLYVLTEIIGKWSMVDVYVVAMMIALVHFEGLTVITTGSGAIFFLLVVVTTMLSAMRFDARLIWDIKEENG
jgi:paraquat-inducible protein A